MLSSFSKKERGDATMTENIVGGRYWRVLTNKTSDIWDRLSFWKKASDVEYNDGNTMESFRPVNLMKRNTYYPIWDIAYISTAPSWAMLVCTTAGTTASTAPTTYSTITSAGTVITDGTAKFTVYSIRPSSTLSNSTFQAPTMSLASGIDSHLIANGHHFVFDYQYGKYGYNTDPNRGSGTFVPF